MQKDLEHSLDRMTFMQQMINLDINMNRITRQILQHINSIDRKVKQINLSKHLKKEVDIGANGTQSYIIKQGTNKGKVIHAFK
jgi:translation initiation factor 1 (eIF-1/SUI1)